MDSTGQIIGANNFAGGETTIERVTSQSSAVLERCNGFKCEDGSAKPDYLVDVLTSSAISANPLTEQVPAAFVDDEETVVIARDSNEAFRILRNATWGSALDACDIVPESTPAKVGPQVVFATKGAHPELMLIEPSVTSGTQVRPLSIKSPRDYVDGAAPNVTAGDPSETRLFDCNGTWSDQTGCTTAKTSTTATLSIASTAGVDAILTKQDIDASNIDPSGKSHLLLDIKIDNDPQNYSVMGMFANDPAQQVSGYEFALYSDTACTVELATLPIPRLSTSQVYRIVFNIGTLTTQIKGIAVKTASFYTPPASGDTYTLTFYGDATWTNDWKWKGNWLLPAVAFTQSPFAAALSKLTSAGTIVDLPSSANIILNPSFEQGSGVDESATVTSWTKSSSACRWLTGRGGVAAHTGSYFMDLDNIHDATESVAQEVSLSPGVQYTLEVWYVYNLGPKGWKITLAYQEADDTPIRTDSFPSSGYYLETASDSWKLKRETFVPPALTDHAILTIITEAGTMQVEIDDVSITAANTMAQGNATILMSQSAEGTDFDPPLPLVEYCYAYAVRDKRSTDEWRWAISNPSKAQDTPVTADPWSSYALSASKLGGRIATAVVNTAGTGYAVGDQMTVSNVKDSLIEVTTVTTPATGDVATVRIIKAGSGLIDASAYTTNAGTVANTGSGNDDCTLDLTVEDATDEYEDYLKYILYYRRIYDGSTQTWSDWKYVGAAAWSDSAAMTFTDTGLDADSIVDLREVPEVLEINNAPASSARYVVGSKGRVYSACLDWDPETEKWMRPTAIQVSSYDKPWAHPTLVTDATLTTDGTELDGYAVSGAIVRGLAVLDEDVLVMLDSEFFHCRGEDPVAGWRFIARQSIGCKSNKSIATSARSVFWHDGNNFIRYSGGVAMPISRFLVDSTSINWAMAHSAAFWKEQYIFHCHYDSQWSLLIFDTRVDAWRIRRSSALSCVGICADMDTVYGITSTGHALNLFGSTTTDGAIAEPVRDLWTRYIRVSPEGYDAQVMQLVFDIVGATGETITVQAAGLGAKSSTVGVSTSREITLDATKTRYQVGVNMKAEFVRIRLTYTGDNPPASINFVGFDRDIPRMQ